MQLFLVVVRADPGVEPVVPAVDPADEVVAGNVTVGHHRPTMETAPIEHRVLVVEAHDYKVDISDQHAHRRPIVEGAPCGEASRFHTSGALRFAYLTGLDLGRFPDDEKRQTSEQSEAADASGNVDGREWFSVC